MILYQYNSWLLNYLNTIYRTPTLPKMSSNQHSKTKTIQAYLWGSSHFGEWHHNFDSRMKEAWYRSDQVCFVLTKS